MKRLDAIPTLNIAQVGNRMSRTPSEIEMMCVKLECAAIRSQLSGGTPQYIYFGSFDEVAHSELIETFVEHLDNCYSGCIVTHAKWGYNDTTEINCHKSDRYGFGDHMWSINIQRRDN